MKIIFAIKTLAHSAGGAERLTVDLANKLHDRNHDLAILTLDQRSEKSFYKVNQHIHIFNLAHNNKDQKTSWTSIPCIIWKIRQTICAHRPDIVVAFMHSIFVPLQIALLGTGIKVIFSEHTVPQYYKKKIIEFWAMNLMCIFVDSITIVSQRIKNLYPAIMRNKMHILSNLVQSNFVKSDVAGPENQQKIILAVGRLVALKEYALLIDSFSILAKNHPDWDLKIIGEGPERKNLEQKIIEHNLQDRIFLSGVSHEMDEEYIKAQIFVHPSRFENFGLVLAEALTHGLPVLGFADCTGINEQIIDGQNGFLVRERTAQALSAALERLMSSKDIRLQLSAGSAQSAKEFYHDDVLLRWEEFLLSRIEQHL